MIACSSVSMAFLIREWAPRVPSPVEVSFAGSSSGYGIAYKAYHTLGGTGTRPLRAKVWPIVAIICLIVN